jgi:hypothetical protein
MIFNLHPYFNLPRTPVERSQNKPRAHREALQALFLFGARLKGQLCRAVFVQLSNERLLSFPHN